MDPIKHVKEDGFELTVTMTDLSYKSKSGELFITPYNNDHFFHATPLSVLYECYENLLTRPSLRLVHSDRSGYIQSLKVLGETVHEVHLIAGQIAEWFGLYDFERLQTDGPNGRIM